jgi:hypothetical protein
VLSQYFAQEIMSDFEMVPVKTIITGVTFAFIIHMHCISIVWNLHYRILSSPFLVTLLSTEIATSINTLTTNKQLLIHMSHLLLAKSTCNGINL